MRTKRLPQLNSVLHLACSWARCALSLLLMLAACNLTNVRTAASSYTVGDSPRVEADVEISRLLVRAGDTGEIRVETTLRHARQTSYQVSQAGDTVQVSVRMQEGFSTISSKVPVEIMITVPPNTDLDLRSSSGYMYVDDVSGQITLVSSAGGLQVSDSQGTLQLETQTGSVVCNRVQGDLRVRSSIGRVDLAAVSGTFDIVTDIGSIRFEGELAAGRSQHFASSGGDIDLRLLGSPDVRVDASSQTGVVRCLLEMRTSASSRSLCRGVVGDGTGELRVQTSTGAITIR